MRFTFLIISTRPQHGCICFYFIIISTQPLCGSIFIHIFVLNIYTECRMTSHYCPQRRPDFTSILWSGLSMTSRTFMTNTKHGVISPPPPCSNVALYYPHTYLPHVIQQPALLRVSLVNFNIELLLFLLKLGGYCDIYIKLK